MTDLRFEIDFMEETRERRFEKRQVNMIEALNNVYKQVIMMV